MVTKSQQRSKQEQMKGRIKVGKLSGKEKEAIKDVSARDQKQIKGGARRTDPHTGLTDPTGG